MKIIILLISVISLKCFGELLPKSSNAPSVDSKLQYYMTNLPLNCEIMDCLKAKNINLKDMEPKSPIKLFSKLSVGTNLVEDLRFCFEEPTLNTGTNLLQTGGYYYQGWNKAVVEGTTIGRTLYPPSYKKQVNERDLLNCGEALISDLNLDERTRRPSRLRPTSQTKTAPDATVL